jgi:hypothetical protein
VLSLAFLTAHFSIALGSNVSFQTRETQSFFDANLPLFREGQSDERFAFQCRVSVGFVNDACPLAVCTRFRPEKMAVCTRFRPEKLLVCTRFRPEDLSDFGAGFFLPENFVEIQIVEHRVPQGADFGLQEFVEVLERRGSFCCQLVSIANVSPFFSERLWQLGHQQPKKHGEIE